MLTVIFAVYVVGLIASLVTLGALSDHVGRKPVLVGAFLLVVASMTLFGWADGTVTLLIARLSAHAPQRDVRARPPRPRTSA